MPSNLANTREIKALRQELAGAERDLCEKADRAARKLAEAEHVAWRQAQDACAAFDCIRQNAGVRLEAIHSGGRERFPGECALAEMALRDADHADAAYTVISFADLRDRLRYLRGTSERESVVHEALERAGVYTDAFGGRHFQGIVR
jgi:hypothetical protein